MTKRKSFWKEEVPPVLLSEVWNDMKDMAQRGNFKI